jgi:hypothetical protein
MVRTIDGSPRSKWPAMFAWVAGVALLAGASKGDEPAQGQTSAAASRSPLEARGALLGELGVTRWHQQGWRGQGVKVAILDSGFRGYRAALGKCLPARVTAKSFRDDGDLEALDSQHGILCAEVLHTLAPDAEILLANWEPDVPDSFVRALAWAKSEGARVATCSVIMPNWSDGAGGGRTHASLRSIVGEGSQPRDLVMTAAAGNLAHRHWTGPLTPNAAGRHQWSAGQHLNAILPWGTERIAVELYGALTSRCRLQVFERESGRLVQEAELQPEIVEGRSWGQTAVRFEPAPRREYTVGIQILDREPPANQNLHLAVLGGTLVRATEAGSIPFPGDGENVLTIGCIDESRQRLPYSSCGPNSRRPKPDFVAQVPFPCRLRERPFTGTSAAAPQGAGLAALFLSRDPSMTPERVREALRTAAVDLLQPGHDGETGYGLLRLP